MTCREIDGAELGAAMEAAHSSVVRVEALPEYNVGGAEAERIAAERAGQPRPERSVRTNDYLAMVAAAAARGVDWQRLRVVDDPLTDYQRYEFTAYIESQACGDQVRIARRADVVVDDEVPDVWLIDSGTPTGRAIVMEYRPDGSLARLSEPNPDDSGALGALIEIAAQVRACAVPLNVYLAEHPDVTRVR